MKSLKFLTLFVAALLFASQGSITAADAPARPAAPAVERVKPEPPARPARPEKPVRPETPPQTKEAREAFLAEKKEAVRELKGATPDERAKIREDLKKQRDEFLATQAKLRDQARKTREEAKPAPGRKPRE